MTDEAMTIAADAAPMPEAQVESGPADTSTESGPREVTARGAIDRAFDALTKREAAGDTGEPVQSGRERNPDGTFKALEQAKEGQPAVIAPKPGDNATLAAAPAADAPSRFSPDAKAAWATVPDAVKAETNRAIRELEGGIQQYQTAFEPYKEIDKQLRTNGQTFEEVFNHYTGIEAVLAQDPIKGLDQICRNMGMSLQQVAQHVMGQPVDQQTQQKDAYVSQLEQKLSALEKQVSGVTTTIKSQQEKAIFDTVDAFAALPEHARFQELADDIVFFMTSGKTKDLKEAYQLAERLNPAPLAAPSPAAPAVTATTAAPQTRKGQLSPSGAPASGSNPTTRQPPASARDALDRAFAATGI